HGSAESQNSSSCAETGSFEHVASVHNFTQVLPLRWLKLRLVQVDLLAGRAALITRGDVATHLPTPSRRCSSRSRKSPAPAPHPPSQEPSWPAPSPCHRPACPLPQR